MAYYSDCGARVRRFSYVAGSGLALVGVCSLPPACTSSDPSSVPAIGESGSGAAVGHSGSDDRSGSSGSSGDAQASGRSGSGGVTGSSGGVDASGTADSGSRDWFPFVMKGLDVSTTASDLSFLNSEAAGARGRVHVENGHFVDGAGQRVRFLGINLTSKSCFPPKEKAGPVAAHLRKLGFNLLRFHFMDFEYAGFVLRDGSLVPDKLDRLDYFIAKLKENGIYVNLNLKTARHYPEIDKETWAQLPWAKILDRFYPPFIEQQKDYARRLIGHENPYTGMSYAKDPAVLNVELNNENTLFDFWSNTTSGLTGVYAQELDRQWNAWLAARYATTEEVLAAWNPAGSSLGQELLDAGAWSVQSPALESVGLENEPSPLLRWSATKKGSETWSLQLLHSGLTLESGKTYTFNLRARVVPGSRATPLPFEMHTILDQPDWHNIGFYKKVSLTESWQDFKVAFRAHDTLPRHGRIVLGLLNEPAEVELADLSLREGAIVELKAEQTLEARTLPRPGGSASAPMLAEYTEFIAETESATTSSLVDNLRGAVGYEGLIADTQVEYGGMRGLIRETTFSDLIDTHSYWQHPTFPNGWSEKNFSIENSTQVAARDGGVLADLARRRVEGLPFTVSEYSVSNPNNHDAETLPLLGTIAAFQDWDAIYAYTYLDGVEDWEADHELGLFSWNGSPAKLTFAPLAALVFRQGLVAAGKSPIVLTVPKGAAKSSDMGALQLAWTTASVPPTAVAQRRLAIQLVDGDGVPQASATPPSTLPLASDTGEIRWDAEHSLFTTVAPAVRLAVGQLGGQRVELSDVTVELDPIEPGYACIQLAAMDGLPLAESKRVLAVIVADVRNTGMAYNEARTTLTEWGHGPTVALRVPLTLTMPGTGWQVQSLDGTGAPVGKLGVSEVGASSRIRLNDEHPSLWFLLSR